jgi:hypothetical protein
VRVCVCVREAEEKGWTNESGQHRCKSLHMNEQIKRERGRESGPIAETSAIGPQLYVKTKRQTVVKRSNVRVDAFGVERVRALQDSYFFSADVIAQADWAFSFVWAVLIAPYCLGGNRRDLFLGCAV